MSNVSQVIMKTHSLTNLQFDIYDKTGQLARTLLLPTEESVMNLYNGLTDLVDNPQPRIGKATILIAGVPHDFSHQEWTTIFVLLEHDWWIDYLTEQTVLLQ